MDIASQGYRPLCGQPIQFFFSRPDPLEIDFWGLEELHEVQEVRQKK